MSRDFLPLFVYWNNFIFPNGVWIIVFAELAVVSTRNRQPIFKTHATRIVWKIKKKKKIKKAPKLQTSIASREKVHIWLRTFSRWFLRLIIFLFYFQDIKFYWWLRKYKEDICMQEMEDITPYPASTRRCSDCLLLICRISFL